MYNAAFQLNKIRRLINTQGQEFHFTSLDENEFGEPNGETVSHHVKGVFHETQPAFSYVTVETSEGTSTRQRSSPMIMTLWESVGGILARKNQLKFNGKTYRVNEIKNLLEANLVADISLEEVQV